jgi:deoxyribodipyrimidine photo-lyase
MTAIFWFRKDLRLRDNRALATAQGVDQANLHLVYNFSPGFSELSPIRQHSLIESIRSLDKSLDQRLSVTTGDATEVLPRLAAQVGASQVFATRAFDTTGMLEQSDVAAALFAQGVSLKLVGSNYAVEPGTIAKDDGSPLRVYTPFFKRWSLHPVASEDVFHPNLVKTEALEKDFPTPSGPAPFEIRAGEDFALRTWERFKSRALMNYSENRNRADLSGTSHLSHALAHGEIHPNTLLRQLGNSDGEQVFRKEIAWREFYADVLFHNPHTLTEYYEPRFEKMQYNDPRDNDQLVAWQEGKTGYPMVDAAMRQLRQTGWMHNRARMIVASFLVKDLHLEWQVGAAWFEQWLTDFDPASNAHGWQWTAGCGTDASPYYRVFNPVLQGFKFDPVGNYVRKYIPELRHISGPEIHEPWKLIDGLSQGYPAPIVDHHVERDESLRRLDALKVN